MLCLARQGQHMDHLSNGRKDAVESHSATFSPRSLFRLTCLVYYLLFRLFIPARLRLRTTIFVLVDAARDRTGM